MAQVASSDNKKNAICQDGPAFEEGDKHCGQNCTSRDVTLAKLSVGLPSYGDQSLDLQNLAGIAPNASWLFKDRAPFT